MIVDYMGYVCFVVPVSKIFFSYVHFSHVHDKPCFVLYNIILTLVDGRLMFFFLLFPPVYCSFVRGFERLWRRWRVHWRASGSVSGTSVVQCKYVGSLSL